MNFWKNKKVLVTGDTGFKGSWLSLWLQWLDAEVIGFSLPPPTTPNLFHLASVEKNMINIIGDIRNFPLLEKTINQYKPEIVFHMAAQPLVHTSYQNPLETYEINVMGTIHLFETLRKSDTVKAIINITTDKCYENKEWHWGYRENDRLGGYDPYSNSKACSELITRTYRDSYFRAANIGLASARAGNVIGGGDWAENRLIPDIIRACIHQHPVSIRRPDAIRPWQHVLEPLHGYLILAEQLYHSPTIYAESWNFGPCEDDIKSVRWIADYLTQRLANKIFWIQDTIPHPHEATFLKLDIAKAKSSLSWQPRWNLEKGLEETACWYQAHQAGENMHHFTLSQIKNFINHPHKKENVSC